MNEIYVRSDKGEYLPGDVVYGVVYLNIVSPTAGRGIHLNIKSQEYFCYEYMVGTSRQKVDGCARHMDSDHVMLYEQEDPFSLGCYKFPFRLRLHNEIPGSFQARGQSLAPEQWLAQVQFWLEALVTCAENMAAHQQLVLCQCQRKELEENAAVQGVTVCHPVRRFSFFQSSLHVTFRLLQNYYTAGESAKGRLVITNNTDTKVVGFKLKLVRSLVLMSRVEVAGDRLSPRMTVRGRRTYVQPELGEEAAAAQADTQAKTIWETPDALMDNQSFCVEDVLDNILIPLKEADGSPAFPSVESKHIQCDYAVEIYLHLSTKEVVQLVCPVKGVLPEKNKQWQQWRAPGWARQGRVLSLPADKSPLVVSHQDLHGEAFAEFPGFQAL